MPFRNTYRLTWVSLTSDVGYLLTAAPPDLEGGVAPLSPPAPRSSRSLKVGKLLLASAPALSQPGALGPTPDLGRGVVPRGHTSARSVAASTLQTNLNSKELPVLGRGETEMKTEAFIWGRRVRAAFSSPRPTKRNNQPISSSSYVGVCISCFMSRIPLNSFDNPERQVPLSQGWSNLLNVTQLVYDRTSTSELGSPLD